nr:MAG: hypothetical protein DIU57_10410 [Pseudomonadota bacterium]
MNDSLHVSQSSFLKTIWAAPSGDRGEIEMIAWSGISTLCLLVEVVVVKTFVTCKNIISS